MSEIHPIRVDSSSREELEKVDPNFLKAGLLEARNKSWQVFHAIKDQLREGMTERDAFQLGMDLCMNRGATKQWHKPVIRFGPGTLLTFREPLQENYKLKMNDAVYIDLGPVWSHEGLEYEGDIGDSFAFGSNAEAEECAETAREIFRQAEAEWSKKKLSGLDLYEFIKKATKDRGYEMIENVEGHRVSDFPHQKYSKERLAKLTFDPVPLLWVLEVQIRHPKLEIGAFYEDLLGVDRTA